MTGRVIITDTTDEYFRRLERATNEGLRAAVLEGSEIASASMPGAGARAIPTNGGRGRLGYVGSNPGQPPGVRTGRLRNSITFARFDARRWGFGTNVRYGFHLELGTRNTKRRPFLLPVVKNHGDDLTREFTRAASRTLAEGVRA